MAEHHLLENQSPIASVYCVSTGTWYHPGRNDVATIQVIAEFGEAAYVPRVVTYNKDGKVLTSFPAYVCIINYQVE